MVNIDDALCQMYNKQYWRKKKLDKYNIYDNDDNDYNNEWWEVYSEQHIDSVCPLQSVSCQSWAHNRILMQTSNNAPVNTPPLSLLLLSGNSASTRDCQPSHLSNRSWDSVINSGVQSPELLCPVLSPAVIQCWLAKQVITSLSLSLSLLHQ